MENTNSNPNLIHQINTDADDMNLSKFAILLVAVLVVGGLIGFGITQFKSSKTSSAGGVNNNINTDKSAGIIDKKTFKDKAEGVLREGGIDGEGNFHLERPGGKSQDAYLTSSTVDLSPYIGKRVRVWGQTFKAQKAGWLMDVGSVEVLN